MAKATIVLFDEEDGRVNANCQVDPPTDLTKDSVQLTPAQLIAIKMMEYANSTFFNPPPPPKPSLVSKLLKRIK